MPRILRAAGGGGNGRTGGLGVSPELSCAILMKGCSCETRETPKPPRTSAASKFFRLVDDPQAHRRRGDGGEGVDLLERFPHWALRGQVGGDDDWYLRAVFGLALEDRAEADAVIA